MNGNDGGKQGRIYLTNSVIFFVTALMWAYQTYYHYFVDEAVWLASLQLATTIVTLGASIVNFLKYRKWRRNSES